MISHLLLRQADRRYLADVTEFELVKNAMYTDPADQSVWIYHRWLVSRGEWTAWARVSLPADFMHKGNDRDILNREIASIQELLDEQPDSKCTDNVEMQIRAE